MTSSVWRKVRFSCQPRRPARDSLRILTSGVWEHRGEQEEISAVSHRNYRDNHQPSPHVYTVNTELRGGKVPAPSGAQPIRGEALKISALKPIRWQNCGIKIFIYWPFKCCLRNWRSNDRTLSSHKDDIRNPPPPCSLNDEFWQLNESLKMWLDNN